MVAIYVLQKWTIDVKEHSQDPLFNTMDHSPFSYCVCNGRRRKKLLKMSVLHTKDPCYGDVEKQND